MSFPLFKDISKNASDFLKKGFPTAEKYAFRVELDNTSSSGIQFTPHLQQTLDKNIEGEIKAKFTVRDHQITTTGNMKEEATFEISPSKHSARGIKWTINLASNLSEFVDKAKLKATLECKSDISTTSLVTEHPFKHGGKSDDSKVSLNTVFGSKEKGLSVGLDSEISLSSFSLKNVNATLAYNKDDIDITVFSKKKFGGELIVGGNYFQKLLTDKWNDAQVAGELSYNINDHTQDFSLGASFKPSDPATLKTRFDSKGLLGFVYTEKWSGPLSVSLGSDWNILGAAGATPFQYNIKLAFK